MTELSQDYYRQYAQAAESHWWFRGRERVLFSVIRPLVRLRAGAVVIDVGSGPGGPARTMFSDAEVVAVDLSVGVLQAYRQADSRIAADAVHLPLRPGSAQVVCAFDVLEHLDDDRAALSEWRRVLASGGWLALSVPAYEELWSAHDEVNQHRRRYRAGALRQLLTRCGFRIVRMTYFNTLLLPGVALMRWAQRLFPAERAQRIQRGEFDCQQRFPGWLERCCEGALRLEAGWLQRHRLPAGVSICAVAQTALNGCAS